MLVHNLRISPSKIGYSPPYAEGRERLKKETDHSKWVGGSFNKQRNLVMMLVLGGHKMSRFQHPLNRNLTVCTETLLGFSHVSDPMVSTTHYFLGYFLEMSVSMEIVGGNIYSRDRGGVRSLKLPG